MGAGGGTLSATEVETLRQVIPGAEFHPVGETGHLPRYEQAGVVNLFLIELLK